MPSLLCGLAMQRKVKTRVKAVTQNLDFMFIYTTVLKNFFTKLRRDNNPIKMSVYSLDPSFRQHGKLIYQKSDFKAI